MPHLPQNNPLSQLDRELGNIEFILRHELDGPPPIGFRARLDFARQHLAHLVEEQARLKRAQASASRRANVWKLKAIANQATIQRQHEEISVLRRKLSEQHALSLHQSLQLNICKASHG